MGSLLEHLFSPLDPFEFPAARSSLVTCDDFSLLLRWPTPATWSFPHASLERRRRYLHRVARPRRRGTALHHSGCRSVGEGLPGPRDRRTAAGRLHGDFRLPQHCAGAVGRAGIPRPGVPRHCVQPAHQHRGQRRPQLRLRVVPHPGVRRAAPTRWPPPWPAFTTRSRRARRVSRLRPVCSGDPTAGGGK